MSHEPTAPENRRAVTGELSWMLWTAIGIGAIWLMFS